MLYQSIPLLYFLSLTSERERLNPPVMDTLKAYKRRAKDKHVAHLRFLFQDYSIKHYRYEVVETYRRIFLLSVLPFVPTLL